MGISIGHHSVPVPAPSHATHTRTVPPGTDGARIVLLLHPNKLMNGHQLETATAPFFLPLMSAHLRHRCGSDSSLIPFVTISTLSSPEVYPTLGLGKVSDLARRARDYDLGGSSLACHQSGPQPVTERANRYRQTVYACVV